MLTGHGWTYGALHQNFVDFHGLLAKDDRILSSALIAVAVIAMHVLALAPLFMGDWNSNSARLRLGAESVIHGYILEVASRSRNATTSTLSPPKLYHVSVDSELFSRSVTRSRTHPPPALGHSGFAVLYGRYLGQIQARIERAWLRPRTAIGSDLFRCQVRIEQKRNGTVGDITLQSCNGTLAWQESLVRAIDNASPLSAPPNPAVYTPHVELVFRSTPYTPEAPPGEFAPPPPPRVALAAANARALESIRTLRFAALASSKNSVIDLRIKGTQVKIIKMKK